MDDSRRENGLLSPGTTSYPWGGRLITLRTIRYAHILYKPANTCSLVRTLGAREAVAGTWCEEAVPPRDWADSRGRAQPEAGARERTSVRPPFSWPNNILMRSLLRWLVWVEPQVQCCRARKFWA